MNNVEIMAKRWMAPIGTWLSIQINKYCQREKPSIGCVIRLCRNSITFVFTHSVTHVINCIVDSASHSLFIWFRVYMHSVYRKIILTPVNIRPRPLPYFSFIGWVEALNRVIFARNTCLTARSIYFWSIVRETNIVHNNMIVPDLKTFAHKNNQIQFSSNKLFLQHKWRYLINVSIQWASGLNVQWD